MIIYHSNGWFEYRTFEGNLFSNGFSSFAAEVKNRYNIDVLTLLN